MAHDGPNTSIVALKSAADLSAAEAQYRAVKLDANGDVIAASAQGERVLGILYNKPAVGHEADVRIGQCLCKAGAAVNEGDPLTVQADGDLEPAATGDFVVGVAITAAGGAGEYFTALIQPVTGAASA